MSNAWAFDLESKIYLIVKVRSEKRLKKKYPDIFFTTDEQSKGDAVFPTVYIHELPSVEQGQDLEGKSINAVLVTIQADIVAMTKKDSKAVMEVIVDEFKQLAFSVIAMPEYQIDSETYRSIARFRRMIGSGDAI